MNQYNVVIEAPGAASVARVDEIATTAADDAAASVFARLAATGSLDALLILSWDDWLAAEARRAAARTTLSTRGSRASVMRKRWRRLSEFGYAPVARNLGHAEFGGSILRVTSPWEDRIANQFENLFTNTAVDPGFGCRVSAVQYSMGFLGRGTVSFTDGTTTWTVVGNTPTRAFTTFTPVAGRITITQPGDSGDPELPNVVEELRLYRTAQAVTVTAVSHTLTFRGAGSIALTGAHTATLNGTGATDFVFLTFTPSAGTLNLALSGQVEDVRLSRVTSTVTTTDIPHQISFFGNGSITLSGSHAYTFTGAGGWNTYEFTPGNGTLTMVTSGQVIKPLLNEVVQIDVGEFLTGPVYSSVKSPSDYAGGYVGYDVSIGTYLSAVANPLSRMYTATVLQAYEVPGNAGPFYGSVCSALIAAAQNVSYSPTTSLMDSDYEAWGYTEKLDVVGAGFQLHDVEAGDAILSDGGGHIETILSVTSEGFEVADQYFGGPRTKFMKPAAFQAFLEAEDYNLIKYGFADEIPDEPDPWSPLDDEILPPAPLNRDLMICRGQSSNYPPGDPITFNIVNPEAEKLVIQRINLPVPSNGIDPITRTVITLADVAGGDPATDPAPWTYATTAGVPGDYAAYLVLSDGSTTQRVFWKVAVIDASMSANIATVNTNVTVTFSAKNCTPNWLIMERARTGSLSTGILRELTAAEIAAGSVTINFPTDGELQMHVVPPVDNRWIVRIRGSNDFGAAWNWPRTQLTLTLRP